MLGAELASKRLGEVVVGAADGQRSEDDWQDEKSGAHATSEDSPFRAGELRARRDLVSTWLQAVAPATGARSPG
jgi:hypothetical protein